MPVRANPSPDPQLWPESRRIQVARELGQGADTLAGLARRHGLPPGTLKAWLRQGPEGDGDVPSRALALSDRLTGPC